MYISSEITIKLIVFNISVLNFQKNHSILSKMFPVFINLRKTGESSLRAECIYSALKLRKVSCIMGLGVLKWDFCFNRFALFCRDQWSFITNTL